MKTRRFLGIMLALIILISALPVTAAETEIRVFLNGEELSFDVPPQLINGRTMAPMRAIFEALGSEIEWDDETQSITVINGDSIAIMQIGSSVILINGYEYELDTPPQLLNGRTFVPVRAVAEAIFRFIRS